MAPTSQSLITLWNRCRAWPGGRWVFSQLLGWRIPYTGTIGARIEALEPGHCTVTLADRRRVRNHLDSIHAVALINLGEVTSGLAMTMALPAEIRGIVTAISATFDKKARGRLTAESRVVVPGVGDGPVEYVVEATISDGQARIGVVRVTWRLARR